MRTICLGLLFLLLCVQNSNGQGIATLETNKPEYEYGEPIALAFTIENPSDTLFILKGSTSCQAQFKFDDFDSAMHTACTLDDIDIMFSPGSYRTWHWELDPRRLGLPDTSGTHTIIGHYSSYSDTLQIIAPKFNGGPLTVEINDDVPGDTLEAIKSNLNAVVYVSFPYGNGVTYEEWGIEGMSPEDAIAVYGNHAAFRSMVRPEILVYYMAIVNTEKETPETVGLESVIYPNPVRTTATLEINGRTLQPVQVKIFDVLGRERMMLYEGIITGTREFTIDGSILSSGIYLYKIEGERVNQQGLFVHIE